MTTGYTDGVMDECRNDERLKEEVGRKGGLELVKTREILEKFYHLKHTNLAGAYPDVNTWVLLPALTILFSIFRRKLLRGPTGFKKSYIIFMEDRIQPHVSLCAINLIYRSWWVWKRLIIVDLGRYCFQGSIGT